MLKNLFHRSPALHYFLLYVQIQVSLLLTQFCFMCFILLVQALNIRKQYVMFYSTGRFCGYSEDWYPVFFGFLTMVHFQMILQEHVQSTKSWFFSVLHWFIDLYSGVHTSGGRAHPVVLSPSVVSPLSFLGLLCSKSPLLWFLVL